MPSSHSNVLAREPELLTLKQASALGYGGYSTLRGYVASGKLPAERIGRLVKVRPADLDALGVPTSTTTAPADSLDAAIELLVQNAPSLSRDRRNRLASALGGDRA